MKKITEFYLTGSPYCVKAVRALTELIADHPEYGQIESEKIEEEMHPELSKQYDYWYVPTFFIGKDKLYEAKPGQTYEEVRENVRSVLDHASGL